MIFHILLTTSLISKCLSKKFMLLPYNSVLCQNNSQYVYTYYEFTIVQQINLNTISNKFKDSHIINNSDSDNYIYYLCRTLVKPMGRPLDIHNEYGEFSFWNIRIRIDRIALSNNCNDYLLLQFRHKENLLTTLEGHSVTVMNITCKTPLPVIVPSDLRKLYITYFSASNDTNPGYSVNVTSFIYFKGKFPIQYQQDLCRRQDGFWCVNETACIFRDMSCDGYDSCFDGGSDEADCSGAGNLTLPSNEDKRRKTSSGFIDYLPWLALGVLPLILLLALICICNQHRSEVYFDDEEDNLDVDKSHEGEDRWSTVEDGLERVIDDDKGDDDDDDGDWTTGGTSVPCCDGGEDEDGCMSLVPLGHVSVTAIKADVSGGDCLGGRGEDDILDGGDTTNVQATIGHPWSVPESNHRVGVPSGVAMRAMVGTETPVDLAEMLDGCSNIQTAYTHTDDGCHTLAPSIDDTSANDTILTNDDYSLSLNI